MTKHSIPFPCLLTFGGCGACSFRLGCSFTWLQVFEIPESGNGVLTPKMNLEPPHYDGIQSLALCNDYLFSGSRDYCIKKWDLSSQSHIVVRLS